MSRQTTNTLEKGFEMVDCLLKVQVLHNVAAYVADLLNSKMECEHLHFYIVVNTTAMITLRWIAQATTFHGDVPEI
jgi:hypothetical protein